MSWATELKISGVTSSGLIAGNEASEADFGTITVAGSGANEGRLNDGEVRTGGALRISAGGEASGTLISGGTLTAFSNGVANETILSTGILEVNGGVANGTDQKGGVFRLYSEANRTTVSGGQMHVNANAVANETILSRSYVYVYRGGTANGTIVSGTANNAVLVLSSGGTANGTIVSGGDLYVRGAETNGTILCKGRVYVSSGAVAKATTVSSGTMNVSSGGVMSGTVFSRGVVTVYNGGSANETTLYGDANTQLVISSGGTANSVTLSGGALYLRDGVANGTIMSNGTVYVSSGGAANSITVNNGTVNISDGGIASDTTIKGGTTNLLAGGIITGGLTFDLTGKTTTAKLLNGAANLASCTAQVRVIADRSGTYTLADAAIATYKLVDGTATLMNGTTYTDFAANLDYTLSGGTLTTSDFAAKEVVSGAAITGAANAVIDAKNGGTIYTGRINGGSTTVTGQYFAAGTDTGSKDLLLEVTDGANTGIIAAGANAGGAVGTGKVKVTGGSTLLLLGGGNTGATQSKAVVEVAGGEVGTLYGGGKQGGYANGIDVSLTGTATVNNIYAGVLHTSGTSDFTIGGEINLDIDAGAVTGFVFGGGKVSVSGSESVTFNNDINITVDGGTFGSGVYALGYAKGTDKTKTALTMASTQEVNVSITGGTFNSNVYLGALTDTAITSGASLKATVTGGKISGLYGGGLAQRGGTANAGAVTISVSGGEIDAIIGGGSHVNKEETTANTTTVDSVAINVSGGTIGSIYAGGHYNDTLAGYFGSDTVSGDAVLTLSGDAEVGKAAGSWRGIDTVGGQRKLVFDDYTGTCKTVCDWDLVTFDGENATTADLSSATVYGVGAWSFDVIGREANAGTALVDIGDWFGSKTTIDLHITDAATSLTTWSLAEFDGSLGDLTFNVYDAASTELASGLALEDTITTGTFTNYGFSVDDATNTLQFGLLSA